MAVSSDLPEFVRGALAKGLPRPRIEEALQRAGWEADQIRGSLAAYADVEFPIPVPRPTPYLSAREAFMYVVLFTALYISAFNLGTLLFDLIDQALPDPATRDMAGYVRESIRWSISSLIVAFPLFLYVARFVDRAVRVDARKRGSNIRYKLTYLTLFVAGSCLIGDVIAVVYNFLGGELTARFVLKTLTIGAIAGPVFGYYLRDLRRDEEEIGGRS